MILFVDILKLLPKSWSKPKASSSEEALMVQPDQSVEGELVVHVEAAALFAHITSYSAPPTVTQFTAPKDYYHAADPDFRLWLNAIRTEYDLLDRRWNVGK